MSQQQLKVLLRAVRVFGLLPLRVHYQPIHAIPSASAVIYCIASGFVFCMLVNISLVGFMWINYAMFITQTTVMFTWSLGWVIAVFRTYYMFHLQVQNRHKIVALFNNALRIRVMFQVSYGRMVTEAPFLDAKCRQLVRWKIGSLIVQMAFLVFALRELEVGHIINASLMARIVAKTFMSMGTDMVSLVYMTMYFAVTLVTLQFFRAVNVRLTETVAVVRELLLCRRQPDAERVRLHCNVTEDIDRIALLYDKVSEIAHGVTDIFAVPLVLTLMNSFLYLLLTLYNLVHDVGKLVDFESQDQPPHVVYNLFCLLYNSINIYFLVWVSDAVIEEASKTGRILCRTASFQIDKATKECIEMFSLSILQGKKLMVACGMISIDKTLVYGMVGALTSYLTILIQFDLAGNSSNVVKYNATTTTT